MEKAANKIEKNVEITTMKSAYERLCETVDITPAISNVSLSNFSEVASLAEVSANERLTAALKVLLRFTAGEVQLKRIDKVLLDSYIAKIDEMLGQQLDEILHAAAFQKLEASWRGLKYLVDRTDFKANIEIDLLDIDKESLRSDFEDAPDVTLSGLYRHVYVQEYDTPGGKPYSTILSDYEFDTSNSDISLLRDISKVAASAHCPFLSSVGARFFGKDSINDVMKIHDIGNYMERADFIRWNSFRDTEDARYVGLLFPRFLLRLPYGTSNPTRSFSYEEQANSKEHENFLWGSAVFSFAANLSTSFKENGWLVNIRGPQAGGKVENLPLHQYDAGRGLQTKIPSEALISETREMEFANLGFIPLSYYKNSDYACFFSANSVQKPKLYNAKEATANSRINARLPYIFLAARIGHYLKVLQRENIGSTKDKMMLEKELNEWIQTLVTTMNNPGAELMATHPLREGAVMVEEIADNIGYYRVSMYIKPHFQIEGVDVRLSLVGQMPAASGS
jgi:type VI secretion system protein ImpC